jgi:FkbM family methyltransferase
MESIWNSLQGLTEGPGGQEKILERKFIESLDIEGFKCLDIGFNYGWWSWLFLKQIGSNGMVYAWEPNRFLYENYLDKWRFKNLIGYDYALSDMTGTQDFYIYSHKEHQSGFNSLEKIRDQEPNHIEKIKTMTLDDWWIENNQPKIDFLKIDCEGHDYKILQGGRHLLDKSRPAFIVVEMKNKEVEHFMKKLGYSDQHQYTEIGLNDSTIWRQSIQSTKEDIE